MEKTESLNVCPVEKAGALDNSIRRFLQKPQKILSPFIFKNMTVLDFGCGPGFFSIEMAKLLDGSGKVIAADLQQGMLNKVRSKIEGSSFEKNLVLHKCESERIGLSEKVDFIFAIYVIHEVPNKKALFEEFKKLLNPNGKILIVEPNFHVTKNKFEAMKNLLSEAGFLAKMSPRMFFSRSLVLVHAE